MEKKWCNLCKKYKPIKEFQETSSPYRKRNKVYQRPRWIHLPCYDKKTKWCRVCKKRKPASEFRQVSQKYQRNDKTFVRHYWLCYKCKDCCKSYDRIYREKNLERRKQMDKKRYYRIKLTPKYQYQYYLRGAKTRGYNFELTEGYFKWVITQPCYYCGDKPPSNKVTGVDRKNNKEGYHTRNCVPCCERCNWSKQTMTVKEFIDFCRKVTEYA